MSPRFTQLMGVLILIYLMVLFAYIVVQVFS